MNAQAVLINFEAQPEGTIISDQFADLGGGQGVAFAGLQPVVTTVPAGQLPEGTHVLDISNCPACEFPVADLVGRFTRTVTDVTVSAGMFADPAGAPASQPAELTLIAFDAGHAVLATSDPITVVPGAGFGSSIAVHDAAGTIASFEITARANIDAIKRIGVASVAFTTAASGAPDFALSLAQAVLELAPTETVTDVVSIEPFNGARGNATLSVQGLPAGTTATFSPNPVSSSSVLTLTAAPDTPLTTGTVAAVISAVPADTSLGVFTRTVVLGVSLRNEFTIGVSGSSLVEVAPCTPVIVTLLVARQVTAISRTIVLSIGGVPQSVVASFDSTTLGAPPGGGLINTVELTLVASEQPFTDAQITVRADLDSIHEQTTFTLHLVPGQVDDVSPLSGRTPQALTPGTTVTVVGKGFCPGSEVAFGNDIIPSGTRLVPLAVAQPTTIAADGRSLQVEVPDLATDGPLTVITPGGHSYPSTQSFTVNSYRNVNGFSSANPRGTGYGFDDVSDEFGDDQTHLLGIIPDPLAALFAGLADQFLAGKGVCFGYCLGTLRFMDGTESFSSFPPPKSFDVWQLDSAHNPLAHLLHLLHLVQLSAEFLHYWALQVSHHIGLSVTASGGSDIRDQIESALRSNSNPLISISFGTKGHVLAAYDVRDDPQHGPNAFNILLYDPDVPFADAPYLTPGELSENSDGATHLKNWQVSSILVFEDGNWIYGLGKHSGDITNIVVAPPDSIPHNPTLPTTLTGAFLLLFGDAAVTSQVSDNAGHRLLQPDGSYNRDAATRLPDSARFLPLSGRGDAELFVVSGTGPITQTMHAAADGSFRHWALGRDFGARLWNLSGRRGSDDEVTVDLENKAIAIRTWNAHTPIQVRLHARHGEEVRTAHLSTNTFRGTADRLSYDDSAPAFTYFHAGAPTHYDLTLEGTSSNSGPFHLRHQRIGTGDTVVLAPSDWHDLAHTPATLKRIRADGSTTVKTVTSSPQPEDDDPDYG